MAVESMPKYCSKSIVAIGFLVPKLISFNYVGIQLKWNRYHLRINFADHDGSAN
jgi:hypothetical protein